MDAKLSAGKDAARPAFARRRAELVAKGAIGFGVLAWALAGGLAPLAGLAPTETDLQAFGGVGMAWGAFLGWRVEG